MSAQALGACKQHRNFAPTHRQTLNWLAMCSAAAFRARLSDTMKTYHCNRCSALVFFRNSVCLSCQSALAFDPARREMVATDPGAPPSESSSEICANAGPAGVCNWLADPTRSDGLCRSCALTRTLPNLDTPGNPERWAKLEAAKRWLLYDLLALDRFPLTWQQDPENGLAFDFLQDQAGAPALTGHASGVITLNIAEADDVERERRRTELGEPIRTLLGHFRHESGHYYWDRLVRDSAELEGFREIFGDERADYGEALRRYHSGNRIQDWPAQFVTEYASAHPWEDWAETWAHYLNIRSMVETASRIGLALQPGRADEPTLTETEADLASIESILRNWPALSYAINQLNRSLGAPDPYPFALPEPALRKIRFAHGIAVGTMGAAPVAAAR